MSIVQWNLSICAPGSSQAWLYDSPSPALSRVNQGSASNVLMGVLKRYLSWENTHYRMEVELPLIVSTLHSKVEEQLIHHTTMFLELSSAGTSEVPEPQICRVPYLRVRVGCFYWFTQVDHTVVCAWLADVSGSLSRGRALISFFAPRGPLLCLEDFREVPPCPHLHCNGWSC